MSIGSDDDGSKSEPSDHRSAGRRRVLLPGLVVYRAGAYTCECTIRSLSPSGARIAMSEHLEIPERFYLLNVRDGVAYDAQVVWRDCTNVGVRFDSTILLAPNTDLVVRRLRELWLAKVTR